MYNDIDLSKLFDNESKYGKKYYLHLKLLQFLVLHFGQQQNNP